MKNTILLFLLSCFSFQFCSACSMYKITKDGNTLVGNNEDWFSPNAQIWFLPKEEKKYGVMHVGFINGFPQGGINEAGLMFDGFAMAYKSVENTKGKIKIPLEEAITHAMQSYATVEGVKSYLSTIDLSDLAMGMLVFVDNTGGYLIVEGDELIYGDEPEQVFSNFYPSESTHSDIPFYQEGLRFLQASEAKSSFTYCASVMNAMKQDITQYSSIYDLEKRTIRIYFFQNLENYQEINLIEELKKGKRKISIPEMFPSNREGQNYYSIYNDSQEPTRYLKNMFEENYGDLNGKPLERAKRQFAQYLNIIGYEWLNDKEDTKGAITIFKYGTELIPDNANLYDSLGEAYLKEENYELAIENYEKSIRLNPENRAAIETVAKLKKRIE